MLKPMLIVEATADLIRENVGLQKASEHVHRKVHSLVLHWLAEEKDREDMNDQLENAGLEAVLQHSPNQ